MENKETIKLLELKGDEEKQDGFDRSRDLDEAGYDGDEQLGDSAIKRIWNATLSIISARRGVLYGSGIGITLGCQLAAVKAVTISPFQIMVYRSFLFLPSVIFVSWDKSNSYNLLDLVCYVSYGICNTLAILLAYVALQFAHIGNVTAISSNLPIPASLIAFFVFKEVLTIFGVLFLTINFIGLILVSKPPILFPQAYDENKNAIETSDSEDEFIGVLIAFTSLISFALSTIFSRKLTYRGNVDPALLSFIAGLTGILIPGSVILFGQIWDYFTSVEEGFICILVGILSAVTNLFIILGLKYESVGIVTAQITLTAPVSFVLGIFIFQELPDLVSIIGAILIIGSAFGILWKK